MSNEASTIIQGYLKRMQDEYENFNTVYNDLLTKLNLAQTEYTKENGQFKKLLTDETNLVTIYSSSTRQNFDTEFEKVQSAAQAKILNISQVPEELDEFIKLANLDLEGVRNQLNEISQNVSAIKDEANAQIDSINRELPKVTEAGQKAIEDMNKVVNQVTASGQTLQQQINELDLRLSGIVNNQSNISKDITAIQETNKSINASQEALLKLIDKTDDRIDQINQQIGDIVKIRTDIDTLKINKADKTFVDGQLADTADKINVSTVDNLLNFSDAESDMEIEVPSYYQAKINEIVNSIDKSELNIGFITDSHNQYSGYAPNSLKHYEYIALLSRLTHLDAVISGGDNANGWYSKPQILSELKSATSALFNRVKPDTDVYFLHGNHDNGAFQNGKKNLEDIITNEELKVLYQTKRNVYREVRNGDSIYCYKDYIDKKIRVIMLNSFDFPNSTDSGGTLIYDNLNYGCYRNEQLNWLSHVALQVPLDYHVLIFTHAPLPGAFDNSTQYNSDVLLNILKAFKNGQNYTINDNTREFPVSIDVDFSNSGTLIAIINGHLHRDDSTVYEGILCISVDASLCYSGAAGRVVNTATEDCWDVFSINLKSRTIKAKRFGFGSDRNWQY